MFVILIKIMPYVLNVVVIFKTVDHLHELFFLLVCKLDSILGKYRKLSRDDVVAACICKSLAYLPGAVKESFPLGDVSKASLFDR